MITASAMNDSMSQKPGRELWSAASRDRGVLRAFLHGIA